MTDLVRHPTPPAIEHTSLPADIRRSGQAAALMLLGAAAVLVAMQYRHATKPQPAPASVQDEGIARTERVLFRLRQTEWGRTLRGRTVLDRLDTLRNRGRIIFTPDLPVLGLTDKEITGVATLYIHTPRSAGNRYELPDELSLAQTLGHEAVHAIRVHHRTTIEEECDAFLVQEDVKAALLDRRALWRPKLEGRSIASFVRGRYPEVPSNPGYRPVGVDRAWLADRAGLPAP